MNCVAAFVAADQHDRAAVLGQLPHRALTGLPFSPVIGENEFQLPALDAAIPVDHLQCHVVGIYHHLRKRVLLRMQHPNDERVGRLRGSGVVGNADNPQ